METWREIPFNTNYLVSDLGNVKNRFGNVLCIRKTRKGYLTVRLMRGLTSEKNFAVHRLVAAAFIPNSDNLPQVNHKDGNKENNVVSNLEWITNLDNMRHAARMGLRPNLKGENHGRAKITEKDAIEIRDSKLSRKELMDKFNISIHIVKDIRSRRSWTHI